MTKTYTEEEVREMLRAKIDHHGDIQALANLIGVKRPFLSAVLNGHAPPSKKMAGYLGLEPAQLWQPIVKKNLTTAKRRVRK